MGVLGGRGSREDAARYLPNVTGGDSAGNECRQGGAQAGP